jgi:hypothetical protein
MTVPRVIDVVPELVSELQRLLTERGEPALAAQVAQLRIIDRCRCGDHFCSTFYTAPRPTGAFGPGHRTIALVPETGYLNVDVVGYDIVQIELLYRDDLKAKIHAAMP